ncbi:LAGLIDADG family homing endonuclease [Patescibacteria group bacterium]|nr:LAGLIDADG family homing endonuclease [Patescibacteria group bacterium]MBU4367853.1 LAGLIDADG family homing endonuclease [Patescibacteria group bacterium]MBU4461692.1 LAGLIDADG family homing endonuclease [Patescibacteria group bacterium]MCG2700313.1 LAGLIDADG family homing endonuclease [Candidatus Parcubacteria bacterium]
MVKKQSINIIQLVNQVGCFDLQFRKDIKYNRPNSPTYYRWKAQFVIAESPQKANLLKSVKNILKCGKIHIGKDQARYSVQNIDEIKKTIIPYFKGHQLSGIKQKDFELWAGAVEIIYKNKRKPLSSWEKTDFKQLMETQKSIKKYKEKPKQAKWILMAEELVKILKK